ncbi:MAG TPA: hypothetical protein P5561_02630 [Candidatus Omnitrophota bacterium]|nr:hypothetical protein [Candidatus Omnitrophota bacterium]HRY85410.1 hypothetical protein [Candidatus Omnitrophota bacterium]
MGQTHEAHAILGIRAARTALAARKAKQALAEDPNAEATKKTNEDLQRLKEENGRSAAQPPSYGKTRF